MFPFFDIFNATCGYSKEGCSQKASQERKLKCLKWIRDDMEARLAGLNASIETIERQLSQEEAAS